MLIICRCLAYGYVKDMLFSLFFRSDPFSGCSGSAFCSRGRHHLKTQHVPLNQLQFLLYVVFYPGRVTRRPGPEKTGVVIPSPCYTSGKYQIRRKPDHLKTAIR